MKTLKRSFTLLMLLTLVIGSRTSAQELSLEAMLKSARSREIVQNCEYVQTGHERGYFFNNPLMLDGKPLAHEGFNVESKGELTVIKATAEAGQIVQVPFYVYLKRNGSKVLIPGNERSDTQLQIDISWILRHAVPGDYLVIEPVRKEDGPVKRVLKLLGGAC